MSPWQALGVAEDVGVADLRRRYAALIKQFRPETHPQDFARIREAYEIALPYARRREAEAAEETPPAGEGPGDADLQAAPPPAAMAAAAPATDEAPGAEAGAAAPTVVATEAPAAEPQDVPPSLAALFHQFRALAEPARGSQDEAWLPALRLLLQARTQATLDDGQALEFALMRWFIEADEPPLTLLFEAGRAFDWHAHVARLSSWLSPWALHQMEARLALSRDLVYARHFSGNPWLRRLHSPQPRLPIIALRPVALEAQFWVERWQRSCAQADTPALAGSLDSATLARMRGFASTDVLTGALVAALAPGGGVAALAGAATAAIAWGGRRGLQAIRHLPATHRLRIAAAGIFDNKLLAGFFMAVLGIIGIALLSVTPMSYVALALGVLLIAPAVAAGVALAWSAAAWLELAAALPFQWREAVDRLEFDRFLASRALLPATQPFGPRLGQVQRWKAIVAARRLQARELAQRERPPRAAPFKLIRLKRSSSSGSNKGRLLWYALWAAFVILRLVMHASGSTP